MPDSLGWTALHHACFFGEAIGSLDDAAALTVDKLSALHLAVLARNTPLVMRLLERSDVRALEANRRFAALLAAELGEVEMLTALHSHNLKSYDDDQLMRLLRGLGGKLSVVVCGQHMQFEPMETEVLALSSNVVLPPIASTLLSDAIIETNAAGFVQKITSERYLVERRDPPKVTYRAGFLPLPPQLVTPLVQQHLRGIAITGDLMFATEELCRLGCTETVKTLVGESVPFWTSPRPRANALIKAGDNRELFDALIDVMPDSAAPTLFETAHEALVHGRVFVADALLRRGLDINGVGKEKGDGTLLMAAARSCKPAVVEALAQWKPNVNQVVAAQYHPMTALLKAISASQPDMVAALLEAGADPNLAGDDANIYTHPLVAIGRSDVYRASFRAEMFAHLIAAGANPNWQDTNGNTPLHVERYTDIQQWLIGAGASFDTRNSEGFSPVMRVVFDSYPVAMGMLQHKRGLDHRDAEGNTLVHLACFSGWPSAEIFKWLRDAGLDLKGRNHAGETPSERAVRPYGSRKANTANAIALLAELTS